MTKAEWMLLIVLEDLQSSDPFQFLFGMRLVICCLSLRRTVNKKQPPARAWLRQRGDVPQTERPLRLMMQH